MHEHQFVNRWLETLECHYPGAAGHAERTARDAVRIGGAMGLAEIDLVDLRRAGLLHDIGLLGVPGSILHKQEALTLDEYAAVQSHPRFAAKLLLYIPFLCRPALWIAHHHERWDGYGYPYGIPGRFIPLGARILAVADTFDAIQSALSRSENVGHESAINRLRAVAGTQLDPELVELFVATSSAFHNARCAELTVSD